MRFYPASNNFILHHLLDEAICGICGREFSLGYPVTLIDSITQHDVCDACIKANGEELIVNMKNIYNDSEKA